MSAGAPPERTPDEVVIDASVAAKWLLRDEDELDAADVLLSQIDDGTTLGYAPRQIDVEIAAALRKAVLTRRITIDDAIGSFQTWTHDLRPKLRLAENDDLLPDALPLAFALGVTVFDALYVTLARAMDITIVVADQRLVRSPALRIAAVRSLSTVRDGPDDE